MTISWRGDGGHAYVSGLLGASIVDDPDELLAHSCITYARNIHTPPLILHNDDDVLCPIEQSVQLFFLLKLLGREVEFVRFPGASHTWDPPGHRVERTKMTLEWFDRHLKL